MHRRLPFCCIVFIAITFIACRPPDPPEFRFNAAEKLKQERLFLEVGEQFSDETEQEITSIMTVLFGSPDMPKFPPVDAELVDLDRLEMAAGAVESDIEGKHRGLYREHCAHCHGITGDGAGATAALLRPTPRDFRMGKFKFKSTPLRTPPTDEDLALILREGIPGTAMPSFRLLPEDEIDALVDYVKYLSMRGQLERALLAEVSVLDGESLIKPEAKAGPSSKIEKLQSQELLDRIGFEFWDDIVGRWENAAERVTSVPSAPDSMQIGHPDHAELTTQGRQLFFTKGNCTQCHGDSGAGDGSSVNYDDWTNDWLKTPGVDPFDRETWKPFIDLGAFPPRPVIPRNLNLGVFRGGDGANQIYRRIANGIEGTPMPASAALSSDEIWALVAYVKSLVHANDDFTQP